MHCPVDGGLVLGLPGRRFDSSQLELGRFDILPPQGFCSAVEYRAAVDYLSQNRVAGEEGAAQGRRDGSGRGAPEKRCAQSKAAGQDT